MEAQAKRPYFLSGDERYELRRIRDEALDYMHTYVEPTPGELKARAAQLAEHYAEHKHMWEAPGHVGPDWETTWRNSARDGLIERQLRAVPEWECFTSRFSGKRCDVCSNSECDHKLQEMCEAWQRLEAEREERARLAREWTDSAPPPPPQQPMLGAKLHAVMLNLGLPADSSLPAQLRAANAAMELEATGSMLEQVDRLVEATDTTVAAASFAARPDMPPPTAPPDAPTCNICLDDILHAGDVHTSACCRHPKSFHASCWESLRNDCLLNRMPFCCPGCRTVHVP